MYQLEDAQTIINALATLSLGALWRKDTMYAEKYFVRNVLSWEKLASSFAG
jgi:hypothetical protein